MKTLYLDCGMGAAGDMLGAALWELLPDRAQVLQELRALNLPGVDIHAEKSAKCGIVGTHLAVTVDGLEENEPGHHVHRGLPEIETILQGLYLPEPVRADALAVYGLIAEAESAAHGVPVTQIHFHEVGTLDAIMDIVTVCLLLWKLQPEQILASPIQVGSGSVRCAHGILPVPAPATAYILKDVPIYGGQIEGELCTPTGAALLKHFVTKFGPMPVMETRAIGYGMGKKDFPRANCVRAFWGDSQEEPEALLELACNVDDMTGEALGFALGRLLEAGALEVYTTPVTMKKSRPGQVLTVICRPEDRQRMLEQVFRHTSTLGVREHRCSRSILARENRQVQSPWGVVHEKVSRGCGVEKRKYEYEDLAKIARETGKSLEEIRRTLDSLF